jgi:hypothetical protein
VQRATRIVGRDIDQHDFRTVAVNPAQYRIGRRDWKCRAAVYRLCNARAVHQYLQYCALFAIDSDNRD